MSPKSSHLFGPVPSRRLGLSLGIDLVPFKTCTLNCIYCELGKTAQPMTERKEYVSYAVLEEEINRFFDLNPLENRIDYITLSGSGEPTLNTALPQVVELLRRKTTTPIALLTNGTLFSDLAVRQAALGVDLILPSLDAVSQEIFAKLNRPAPELDNEKIIAGLIALRREFSGQIWLEILFCRGFNDNPEEIFRLIAAAKQIMPDRIQLNTVVRPGVLSSAQAVSAEFLAAWASHFTPPAEIIAPFSYPGAQTCGLEKSEKLIIETLKRRPCTLADLEKAMGLKRVEVLKIISLLLEKKQIKPLDHEGRRYYQSI